MKKTDKADRRRTAIQKELTLIEKQEAKLRKAANRNSIHWKEELEQKVPVKIRNTLEITFCKAFSIVFEKGTGLIEKTYKKERLGEDYKVQDYAVQIKGSRKELRQMKSSAQAANLGNIAISTVEGIGLGVLGIGLPDVVIFVGLLLKGIYETALHYGYDYNAPEEKLLILKMMETALSKGQEWTDRNAMVEEYLLTGIHKAPKDGMNLQMERTSHAFAMDMLLLKFIQGIPVVGILGGAGNPVYYRRVISYVRFKYHKRYLLDKLKE